jgi:hypothetical protein
MSPLYVYGVLADSRAAPGGDGIGGGALRCIEGAGLSALVSDVTEEQIAFGREAMRTHAEVLEQTHAATAVLPMRFGTVMADQEAVIGDLLERHGAELRSQLGDIEGKVELRVRAMYEEEPVLREILAEDLDVARLRDSLRGASPEATHYGQLRLGELVAYAWSRKREADAGAILERLEPLAIAVDLAPVAHERMVFNASFLVERDRIGAFDRAVDALGGEQVDRMRFRYLGPLPPHSFVRLAQEV